MKTARFKIAAIGVGVLALVALALVCWGVTHHSERTGLEVCWEGDRATYGRTDCDTSEIDWPQIQVPLLVAFATDPGVVAPTEAEQRVLTLTVQDLNRELGFELFRVSPDRFVEIRLAPNQGGQAEGRVQHLRNEARLGAYVMIEAGLSDSVLGAVLRHELLHVVGLAHDDFTLSVMYPFTPDDDLVAFHQRIVTDADRAWIRSKYMTR